MLDGGVDPVQVSHDHVGDEHVGRKTGGDLDGLLAGIDGAGFKSALVQDHGKSIGDHPLVVGNQNLGFVIIFRHTLVDA